MYHFDLDQGSDEWLKFRLGKVTASRMADMTARTKSGWGASRANYMAELIAERLTGQTPERFVSWEMKRGTEVEPEARSAYDFYIGESVDQVGFISHEGLPMAGASPDGLIGSKGMVEIKCPNTATHIETLRGGAVPERYIKQMQFQMACAEREWCDFVSFDNRLPERMAFFVRRVQRDDAMIRDLETDTYNFLAELDAIIDELKKTYGVEG